MFELKYEIRYFLSKILASRARPINFHIKLLRIITTRVKLFMHRKQDLRHPKRNKNTYLFEYLG